MAQRTVVWLTDDLSGAEIPAGKGETVVFSLDGRSYEIDLTARNARALRKVLRPYIEAGRPIKRSRSRRAARARSRRHAWSIRRSSLANAQ